MTTDTPDPFETSPLFDALKERFSFLGWFYNCGSPTSTIEQHRAHGGGFALVVNVDHDVFIESDFDRNWSREHHRDLCDAESVDDIIGIIESLLIQHVHSTREIVDMMTEDIDAINALWERE